MKKEQKNVSVIWIKRILGFTAVTLWITIIYTIPQSPAPFIEQAPYCIVSTMMIFGLLSMSYKGLEYWEKQA